MFRVRSKFKTGYEAAVRKRSQSAGGKLEKKLIKVNKNEIL